MRLPTDTALDTDFERHNPMGLDIEVGYLADLLENDEEGAESFRDDLASLNEYLASLRLAAHHEPEQCEVFSCDMYGYSGIHYLRRIAAHLDLRSVLPPPGGEDAHKDKVVIEYNKLFDQGNAGLLAKLFRRSPKPRGFDHLMFHSDAEGYYLPQDFPSVLFPPERFEIPGGMIGSTVRLREECCRLAAALQLSLDLDHEAEEVWEAPETQGDSDVTWKRYGIESFTCLRLYKACEHSIKWQAAIVFC
jgi:hypothetical protein